jgi:hypothetical protein
LREGSDGFTILRMERVEGCQARPHGGTRKRSVGWQNGQGVGLVRQREGVFQPHRGNGEVHRKEAVAIAQGRRGTKRKGRSPCCWHEMSQRIRSSPGGAFCRSFRTLAGRRSRWDPVGVWASRPSPCGSCRSRPGRDGGRLSGSLRSRADAARACDLGGALRLVLQRRNAQAFRLDLARLPRAASGEFPSAWRDDVPGKRAARKNS